MNRVTSIKDGSTKLAAYTYLGAGTVVVIEYKDEPGVKLDLWGGTVHAYTGLDDFGRVIDQLWTDGSPVDEYTYTYDDNSNRLTKGNALNTPTLDEAYTYDTLNRLTQMLRGTSGGTATQDWSLDATGNWNGFDTTGAATPTDAQTRTANQVNEITAISSANSWAAPTYDAAGNMIKITKASSPTNLFDATYDAWNRLVEIDYSSSLVAKYRYDGSNRRITRYDGTNTRHAYFSSKWQVVEERVNSSTSSDLQYVYGIRYVDELVCGDSATYGRMYVTQDANFNVTSLIVKVSGVWGVQERYAYDPYGARAIFDSSWTSRGSSSYDWVLGFQGRFHDNDTGLIDFRNRWSLPALGLLIQRDAAGYVDGASLYEFVRSAPVSLLDPMGLEANCMSYEFSDCWDCYHEALARRLSGSNECTRRAYEAGQQACQDGRGGNAAIQAAMDAWAACTRPTTPGNLYSACVAAGDAECDRDTKACKWVAFGLCILGCAGGGFVGCGAGVLGAVWGCAIGCFTLGAPGYAVCDIYNYYCYLGVRVYCATYRFIPFKGPW